MNKCCEEFIRICYLGHYDMIRLEWNFCPKCGEQISAITKNEGETFKRLYYNKPTVKYIEKRVIKYEHSRKI